MKRFFTALGCLALLFATAAHAQTFLTIGTGGVTGIYYPVGGATSRIVNEAGVGLRLTVESTGGSVFNITAIRQGQLDLALAQSDFVYQAYNGMGRFEGDAFEGLRTLIGLHAEPMHLVCLQGAGVNQFSDIAGKRVSMGDPGSGTLFTAQAMLEAKGMSEAQVTAEYLRPAEAPDFLRDGRIDCFFYTVGVGNAAIRDIMATANAMLVPLDDPEFEGLIEEFPYYAFSTVPAGTYGARQPDPVTLFGVKALFVGSTDLSDDHAYAIVKAVFDNLAAFQAIHPALADLTAEDFLTGLGAPLHPGAERAYREVGLIP
jgi:uncharacterized protein